MEVMDDEFTEATARGSSSWPGWGRIISGLNPVSILKDGFEDIGGLKWSNWRSLAAGATWKDAQVFAGNPEIHAAVQGLGEDLNDVAKVPAVHAFLGNVTSNENMWRLVTVPAVTVDWFNHALDLSGIRDKFLDDTGLGWAR